MTDWNKNSKLDQSQNHVNVRRRIYLDLYTHYRIRCSNAGTQEATKIGTTGPASGVIIMPRRVGSDRVIYAKTVLKRQISL